jgi:hypothetical protein
MAELACDFNPDGEAERRSLSHKIGGWYHSLLMRNIGAAQ